MGEWVEIKRTWHDTALSLHELQKIANDAAAAVTALGPQITAVENMSRNASNLSAAAKTAISDAQTKLADLRRRLGVAAPRPAAQRAPAVSKVKTARVARDVEAPRAASIPASRLRQAARA